MDLSIIIFSEVRTPEDRYKVGATAHIIEKRWEYDLEIIESLKNEKLMTQTKGGKHGMGYTSTSILKPIQDGTKLTLVLDIEPGYGLLGKAMYGLLRSAEEKVIAKTLEKLKSILQK